MYLLLRRKDYFFIDIVFFLRLLLKDLDFLNNFGWVVIIKIDVGKLFDCWVERENWKNLNCIWVERE